MSTNEIVNLGNTLTRTDFDYYLIVKIYVTRINFIFAFCLTHEEHTCSEQEQDWGQSNVKSDSDTVNI